MSKIYENQPLKLTATVTQNRQPLENPLTAAEWRLWKTNTPVGNVPDLVLPANILDAVAGTIEHDIGENILDVIGVWRYQVYGTTGGLEFPAKAGSFKVEIEGT
jgi:hypothetical protein